MVYAGYYLVLAIFSPVLVRLFLALPHTVIAVITGLALIPALLGSVDNMLATKDERDVAILTFLTTGSGVVLLGLGTAIWGLVVGFVALGAKKLIRS
jgi:benzoate membrane transport protein